MKELYIEKIYAGWLGKMIGIRHGALIEGWDSDQIREKYGEIDGYFTHYDGKLFAADDDSNGPEFLVRALLDQRENETVRAEDIAEALLNYAPFEHGFFWWGGYGISTEHTAYLNLHQGILPPESGSMRQNGKVIAEQIGGQIFIDSWGLVTPGDPEKAAYLAREAASVTHDGEGIYGGIFVACCISAAFEKKTVKEVIEIGLHYIPTDCIYARMTRGVQRFYHEHPGDWRECLSWIKEHYGYDKYGGNCHIIPNAAVMVLSLLYGEGDFSKTINICNMCGWDTDCNVGNIGTVMGVFCGIEGMDFEEWGKELQDLLISSSTVGYLNNRTISEFASELVIQAYRMASQALPPVWEETARRRSENCHFEFPGAVHGFLAYTEGVGGRSTIDLENSVEKARSGQRSLHVGWMPGEEGEQLSVVRRSYYFPEEFYDSRYNPAFSPKVYPGQEISGWVYAEQEGFLATVCTRDEREGVAWESEPVRLIPGKWTKLVWNIPSGMDALITEYGFSVKPEGKRIWKESADFYFDDIVTGGAVDYVVDFTKEKEEVWTNIHREVSQFTRMKGNLYLEDGVLNLSCTDLGEAYTGYYYMSDCCIEARMIPHHGDWHLLMLRVQGARRSYAAGFSAEGQAAIFCKNGNYEPLVSGAFDWECGREYTMCFEAVGTQLTLYIDGRKVLEAEDHLGPQYGCVGIAVKNAGRSQYHAFSIREDFGIISQI